MVYGKLWEHVFRTSELKNTDATVVKLCDHLFRGVWCHFGAQQYKFLCNAINERIEIEMAKKKIQIRNGKKIIHFKSMKLSRVSPDLKT